MIKANSKIMKDIRQYLNERDTEGLADGYERGYITLTEFIHLAFNLEIKAEDNK